MKTTPCILSLLIVLPLAAGTTAWAGPDAQSKEKVQEKHPTTQPSDGALVTERDRFSYAVGLQIASGIKRQSVDVNLDLMVQAIKDAMGDQKTQMTMEEARKVMQKWQQTQAATMKKRRAEQGGKNQKEGEAFLAENKKKEGVKTLPSGLQYRVIQEGTGAKPAASDTVSVHYRGRLINGTEFDSSYSRGRPAQFPVKGVIPGWTEALQQMKVGSKWELYIPSSLAYGPRGSGQQIGPNATLIFEVELLSIVAPTTQARG